MGSDRHAYLDERTVGATVSAGGVVDTRPDRSGDPAADRYDGRNDLPGDLEPGDLGPGADRAWPGGRGGLCELYRDDPDDIFVEETPVEPRRMRLDTDLDGGRTARDFLNGFDPALVYRRGRVEPVQAAEAGRPAGSAPDGRADREPDPGPVADRTAEQARQQPRMAALADQEPCVQRVYAAFGGGGFHGAERHEGSMDDQDHLLRLVERQDPAQPDEDRRARGIDAFKKGNGKHVCAESSTSICDPVAYAVALARGLDHPTVRAALDARHDPPRRPYYVQVPIVELLGEHGDEFCRGHQLVGAEPRDAVKERDVWAKAGWKGKPRDDLPPPLTEQIATFRDGVIEFRIGHNAAKGSYELISMFPRPRRDR